MSWIFISILAYLILALISLVDKYFLTDRIPNPKVLAFYSGFFSTIIIIIIPFIDFQILSPLFIFLALSSGASFFMALFWLYTTLKQFEVSRVIPAIGAFIPLSSLLLAYISSRGQATLQSAEIPSFIILIFGSFMINYEYGKAFSSKSLFFAALTSFFFSLHFILSKHIYIEYPFWSSIIWINLGGFLMAMIFYFFFEEIRKEIHIERISFEKKTIILFVVSKTIAGLGGLLQNWAIFLAPSLAMVAIINSLQGLQYAFLLLITIFLSIKYPKIIKEEITKKIIFQKSFSILLIMIGISILFLFNL